MQGPAAGTEPPPGWPHRLLVLGALLAVVVVGAVLRAGPLGPSSLWLDDAAPALALRADGLHGVLVTGMTAPGFALLLRGVFAVAGFSELAAQALPFALGVLGAPLAWWAARRGGLRGGAVLAAGVVLTSPLHLSYSSRVKPYTLDLALCLLLVAAAFVLIRDPSRRASWWRLAALSSVAVFLSASVAATVVAAFAAGAVAALRARVLPRQALLATAAAAALAVTTYATLVRPASTDGLRAIFAPFFLPRDLAWPAAFFDRLSLVGAGLLPLPGAVGAVLVLVAAGLVVVRRSPAVAVLLLIPLAVATLLATVGLAPLGAGRTDIHLYASLALLLGSAADGLFPRADLVVALGLAGGLLAVAPPPLPYVTEDVRPLIEQLEQQRRPGDLTLVYSATRAPFGLYTSGVVDIVQTSVQANNFDPVPRDPDVHVLSAHRVEPAGMRPEVRSYACGRSRVWLLASHTTPDIDVARDTLTRLGLTPVQADTRPGAELQLWAGDPAPC